MSSLKRERGGMELEGRRVTDRQTETQRERTFDSTGSQSRGPRFLHPRYPTAWKVERGLINLKKKKKRSNELRKYKLGR